MKKSLAVVAVAALLSGLFAGPAQAKDVKLTGGGAGTKAITISVGLTHLTSPQKMQIRCTFQLSLHQ